MDGWEYFKSEIRTPMWWLIFCVNLTGWRDTQIAGKTFLHMSETVFLQEISTWLSKEDPRSSIGVGINHSLWARTEPKKKKKKRRQGKFPPSHLELGYPYFLPQILELWVLRPSDSGTYTSGPLLSRPLASDWELHHQLLRFSVLLISTGLYPRDFLVL